MDYSVKPTRAQAAEAQARVYLDHLAGGDWLPLLSGAMQAREANYLLDALLRQHDILREELGMPRKQQTMHEWNGFADVKLNSQQREEFKAWDYTSDMVWAELLEAIAGGHKLTFTYNPKNDQISASLTGQKESKKNAGYTLSAFAKTWDVAARLLCYKHVVLAGGDWKSAQTSDDEDFG